MSERVGERELAPGAIIKLAMMLNSLSPPKLSFLIVQLDEVENIKDFFTLIDEFLPDKRQEILAEISPTAQVAAFCTAFEDRYLPLDTNFLDWEENEVQCYGALLEGVPVYNLSFDVENEYHEIPERYDDSVKLMTFLIECPWDEDGARIAIGESCDDIVPRELLAMVPAGGFTREALHKYLDRTRYKPIATWADMMYWDTGNYFFDMEITRCGCGFGHIPIPEWDKKVIKDLTEEWQQSQKMIGDFESFKKWLGEKPAVRFKEVLDFLLRKEREANGETVKPGQAKS
jgi:hypothetical protein